MQRDRVREGYDLINAELKPDKDGELYFGALQEWAEDISTRTDDLIEQTRDILERTGHAVDMTQWGAAGEAYHGDAFVAD